MIKAIIEQNKNFPVENKNNKLITYVITYAQTNDGEKEKEKNGISE